MPVIIDLEATAATRGRCLASRWRSSRSEPLPSMPTGDNAVFSASSFGRCAPPPAHRVLHSSHDDHAYGCGLRTRLRRGLEAVHGFLQGKGIDPVLSG